MSANGSGSPHHAHRRCCFSGRTEAGRHASYQLAVQRNGKKAHVDAPGISADFTHRELVSFLTDPVTSWADIRRSRLQLATTLSKVT